MGIDSITRQKQYKLMFTYFTTDAEPTKIGAVEMLHKNNLPGSTAKASAFYRALIASDGRMPSEDLLVKEMRKQLSGNIERLDVDPNQIRLAAARKSVRTKQRKMEKLQELDLSEGTAPVSEKLRSHLDRVARMSLDHGVSEIRINISENGPPMIRLVMVPPVVEFEARPS